MRRETLYLQAAMEFSIYYKTPMKYEITSRKASQGAIVLCNRRSSDLSHVKITCFHAKPHLVFHWCLCNNDDDDDDDKWLLLTIIFLSPTM